MKQHLSYHLPVAPVEPDGEDFEVALEFWLGVCAAWPLSPFATEAGADSFATERSAGDKSFTGQDPMEDEEGGVAEPNSGLTKWPAASESTFDLSKFLSGTDVLELVTPCLTPQRGFCVNSLRR